MSSALILTPPMHLQASNASSVEVDLQTSLACVFHDALPDAEEERDEANVMFCGGITGSSTGMGMSNDEQ